MTKWGLPLFQDLNPGPMARCKAMSECLEPTPEMWTATQKTAQLHSVALTYLLHPPITEANHRFCDPAGLLFKARQLETPHRNSNKKSQQRNMWLLKVIHPI
jgi:hypothetical protein